MTLTPATLQRLSVGAHTVTILYDNGSVNTRLTVLRPSNTPKTGDESHTALWLTVLAVSGIGMAATLFGTKKRRAAKRLEMRQYKGGSNPAFMLWSVDDDRAKRL